MADFVPRKRKQTYEFYERRLYSELIAQYGARGTRELLFRRISLGTLLKIAKEFGVELRKGRRLNRAA